MNKYNKNIITIIFIVLVSLMLFAYWLNLNFGYGQITLILAGGYCIYLNLKAKSKGCVNVKFLSDGVDYVE